MIKASSKDISQVPYDPVAEQRKEMSLERRGISRPDYLNRRQIYNTEEAPAVPGNHYLASKRASMSRGGTGSLIGGPDRAKFFGNGQLNKHFGSWFQQVSDSQLVAVPVPTNHNLGR
jgi:hypothetical protein